MNKNSRLANLQQIIVVFQGTPSFLEMADSVLTQVQSFYFFSFWINIPIAWNSYKVNIFVFVDNHPYYK